MNTPPISKENLQINTNTGRAGMSSIIPFEKKLFHIPIHEINEDDFTDLL